MSQLTDQSSSLSDSPSETASTEGQAAIPELPPIPTPSSTPVLQKLSAPPFPRSGFPLLGVLASIYEHVVAVGARLKENGSRRRGEQS